MKKLLDFSINGIKSIMCFKISQQWAWSSYTFISKDESISINSDIDTTSQDTIDRVLVKKLKKNSQTK